LFLFENDFFCSFKSQRCSVQVFLTNVYRYEIMPQG
jgi:hypothetical protein